MFSQQSEGSPHLLQLNALICLLWRLKVLGLVRQENKCCNFHQQSGCSDTELTPKLVEELHSKSFPGCGLHMGLVLPSPRLCTALSLCVTETWGCSWLQLWESLRNFIFLRPCQCNAFFILRNDFSVYIETPSRPIAGVTSTGFMLQINQRTSNPMASFSQCLLYFKHRDFHFTDQDPCIPHSEIFFATSYYKVPWMAKRNTNKWHWQEMLHHHLIFWPQKLLWYHHKGQKL